MAYYGHHYSTFCYHTLLRQWGYFDDAKFRTVGTCAHACTYMYTYMCLCMATFETQQNGQTTLIYLKYSFSVENWLGCYNTHVLPRSTCTCTFSSVGIHVPCLQCSVLSVQIPFKQGGFQNDYICTLDDLCIDVYCQIFDAQFLWIIGILKQFLLKLFRGIHWPNVSHILLS